MTKWLTRKRCWAVLEGFNECQLVERSNGDILIDSRNQVGPTNPTVSRDGALLSPSDPSLRDDIVCCWQQDLEVAPTVFGLTQRDGLLTEPLGLPLPARRNQPRLRADFQRPAHHTNTLRQQLPRIDDLRRPKPVRVNAFSSPLWELASLIFAYHAIRSAWYFVGPNAKHAIPGVFPPSPTPSCPGCGTSTTRYNLTLSVSADEGEAWSPVRDWPLCLRNVLTLGLGYMSTCSPCLGLRRLRGN